MMGYLLKEALKTLCGVNQWSYAVFWKIGCQNPKLLIWEECYYEASPDYNASWVSAETRNLQSDIQNRNKVHLLVNKMMMENHVNIVGEGLVGRVAFTGNHQWIISEDYFRESHPPEVLKEVCQQFSAGMQTIAVIPVLPHGVVQFGSFLPIMENMGFINDVTSLILQLGYVSGLTLPENYATKEHSHACSSLESNVVNAPNFFDNFNFATQNSGQTSTVDSQTSFSFALQPNGEAFHPSSQLANGGAKAEIIPSSSEIWTHQYIPKSTLDIPSTSSCTEQKILPDIGNQGHFSNFKPAANGNNDHLNMADLVPGFYDGKQKYETGDDLFDILGADFKNKLFSSCWSSNNNNNNNNSTLSNKSAPNWDNKNNLVSKKNLSSSEMCSTNSESGIFSSTGTDNLLEAVVSKVNPLTNQSADDNISCRTTVTNMSTSSAPNNSSLPYGRFGVSELFGVPKYVAKSASTSLKASKEESGSYSNGSSIYGSQISSWIESDQKSKTSNSISTGYSKKQEETGKTNRKRLKSGENPRPRPKDRQMIQDRVKELREIVPNGAKCSIDALLERTIKHMLFLQSVTKHADKLKQTGESKIISKDGGLLLKDNFDGGATWAYEVGSESMVCPIIVEDLNQPRQMLVEMLCEERGLFLEIADIIRGLGLTILKGVMETRNDKIWARFAVEANRDVTRMEIFISLVRLLEQTTAKNGVPQPINGENVMAQQFHQVESSVPLAGRAHSLN